MTSFHALKVAKVEPETTEAVEITFTVPVALAGQYAWRPGQHLTLKTRIGNEEIRRCYSICRAGRDGEISVAVKGIANGRFSQYALRELRPGMELEVMVPQGTFGYAPDANTKGNYLALAVGSGITPMLAIIEATLSVEPHSQFTLIYGNRSSRSTMFRQALADLKDRWPQRLQLVYLFSQEQTESELFHGRPDGAKLRALGDTLIDFSGFDRAFICGPQMMMQETQAALISLGLDGGKIGVEHFNTPDSASNHAARSQAAGRTVTLRHDGHERKIVLEEGDESLLDAALRQGADLPFACKGGVCATCKCRVVSGEAEMAINYSLEADQIAAGYILSCQALPKGDGLVVDFDV